MRQVNNLKKTKKNEISKIIKNTKKCIKLQKNKNMR